MSEVLRPLDEDDKNRKIAAELLSRYIEGDKGSAWNTPGDYLDLHVPTENALNIDLVLYVPQTETLMLHVAITTEGEPEDIIASMEEVIRQRGTLIELGYQSRLIDPTEGQWIHFEKKVSLVNLENTLKELNKEMKKKE